MMILFFAFISLNASSQTITDFSLTNVHDGKQVSLKDFSNHAGFTLIFTSVACPFDAYYVNRLKELQTTYADKFPILLVNAYTEAPEGEEWMKKTADANGLSLPYLTDKSQQLMTQVGAQRSPEAFVLKNNKGQFTVVYRGALDDNAQAEAGVKQAYLKNAIDAVISGKNIAIPSTRTVGCFIRKK